MTYAEKNHRLSFLNIEPTLYPFGDGRVFNKSLPKSSSDREKLKLDRKIFTTLSKKMRKSRVTDQQNQHKLSMQDEILNSPPTGKPRIFTRNFSLASLRIHGTNIIVEPPEQKSFHNLQKKERLCINVKDSEKKILIKKNKKSSSIQNLLLKSKPKIATKTFFSETAYTKFLKSPETIRLNKPDSPGKIISNQKSNKSLISPLLNFKQITIKSTKNNNKKTHTDRIELKVYPEDLDISGW